MQGSEQSGIRPAVIISDKSCPVIQPDKLNKLKSPSQVITFQIRTIAKSILKKRIGLVSEGTLELIEQGVKVILNY